MKLSPKITVITPSYNQGKFLKRTIQSVVSQKYPNLEYLIYDGGSTDNSVKIIERYAKKYPQVIKWRSKKDNGQVDAINRGLKAASGELIGYLNSDDYYLPGTLRKVVKEFAHHPRHFWLTGFYKVQFDNQRPGRNLVSTYVHFWILFYSRPLLLVLNMIPQPSTFWRKKALNKVGLFNRKYKFAFDYDYWLKLAKHGPPIIVRSYLSVFRKHSTSKSANFFKEQFDEQFKIARRNAANWLLLTLHLLHTHIFIIPIYTLSRHLR